MITKYSDKYKDLFQKASNELGITIENLDDYFMNFPDLLAKKDVLKQHPEFVILPADESFFEINANTRKINIPNEFKTLASVTGDEAAEVVYFSVNRYFDTMDLNNQSIYIEWNSPTEGGRSKEFIRAILQDEETKEDKLVFGWALQRGITASAGQVEFAVRFYTIDEKNNLTYSLSTLPAKITIGKAIEQDVDILESSAHESALDPYDLIVNRIVASNGVFAPDIKIDVENRNFAMDENTKSYSDYVLATSRDGEVSYYLYKKNEKGEYEKLSGPFGEEEYTDEEGNSLRGAKWTVTESGDYRIIYRNTKKDGKIKDRAGNEFFFPLPSKPIIKADSSYFQTKSYYITDPEQPPILSIDESKVIFTPDDIGTHEYKWEYSTTDKDDYSVDNETKVANYTASANYEYYKVTPVHNLNNETASSDQFLKFRVTKNIDSEKVNITIKNETSDNGYYYGDTVSVEVECNGLTNFDKIEYTWKIGTEIIPDEKSKSFTIPDDNSYLGQSIGCIVNIEHNEQKASKTGYTITNILGKRPELSTEE